MIKPSCWCDHCLWKKFWFLAPVVSRALGPVRRWQMERVQPAYEALANALAARRIFVERASGKCGQLLSLSPTWQGPFRGVKISVIFISAEHCQDVPGIPFEIPLPRELDAGEIRIALPDEAEAYKARFQA